MAKFSRYNNPTKKKVRRRVPEWEREMIKAQTYDTLGYKWHTDKDGKVVPGQIDRPIKKRTINDWYDGAVFVDDYEFGLIWLEGSDEYAVILRDSNGDEWGHSEEDVVMYVNENMTREQVEWKIQQYIKENPNEWSWMVEQAGYEPIRFKTVKKKPAVRKKPPVKPKTRRG